MHVDQIIEAEKMATPVTHNITAVDTDPWMVVQYVPTLGTGGTSASIAYIVASSMTFLVDSSTPAGADAIGTSGVILTSTAAYDTMGELVDYINGRQAWRAYLVGALRADNSSLMLAKSATACHGANGLTFYGDTSSNKMISLAVSGEKFVNNGKNGHVKDWDDQCINRMYYGYFKVTCASTHSPVLRYYTGLAGSTETQIASDVALVSGTAQQDGEENFTEPYIEATRGHRLVIRVICTSAQPPTSPTVNVLAKTAVLSGARQVTEDNY